MAALSSWHTSHSIALGEIERRLEEGESMLLAAHSLVETYSVLTRMPPGFRISPSDAASLIRDLVVQGTVVAPEANDYAAFISGQAARGVAGGRVYDGLIAHTADHSGVDVLMTFNVRHFQVLTVRAEVSTPGAG